MDSRKERSDVPWKSRLRCNQKKRRSQRISGTDINRIFHFDSQQGVLGANDHHFPFIKVVLIYKAGWKALHRVPVELCNKKTNNSKPSSQNASGKVVLKHLHSYCMCSACVEDGKHTQHMDSNPCLTLTNPLFDHIFVMTEMCFTAAAPHVWTAKTTSLTSPTSLWFTGNCDSCRTQFLTKHPTYRLTSDFRL